MLLVVLERTMYLRLCSTQRGDTVLLAPVCCNQLPDRCRLESWLQAVRLQRSAGVSDMSFSDRSSSAGKAEATSIAGVLASPKACNRDEVLQMA
jgi:hypothetical protein